jgi:hypothetical protein
MAPKSFVPVTCSDVYMVRRFYLKRRSGVIPGYLNNR